MQLKTVGESLAVISKIKDVLSDDVLFLGTAYEDDAIDDLVDSLKKYSTEAVKTALAESDLKKSQLERILTSKGLEGQALEDAVAQIVDAQAKNKNADATDKLTKKELELKYALGGLWDSFKTFATSTTGILTIATTVAIGATMAISKWAKADEEALESSKERLNELSNEYESITSEVDGLESQISSLNQQISELDPITDEAQIQALKDERAELEQEVALLKQRQEYLAQEEGKTAEEALEKKVSSKYSYDNYEQTSSMYTGDMSADAGITLGHIISNQGVSDQVTEYEELSLAMEEVNKLEKQRAELKKKQADLDKDSTEYDYDEEWNKLKTQIDDIDSQITDVSGHATTLASSVQSSWAKLPAGELKDSIGGILVEYFELTGAVDAATASFNALSTAQQKNILVSKLVAQGFTEPMAQEIMSNFSEEDFAKLFAVDWSNVIIPKSNDYGNDYKAWGKDIAKAWLEGFSDGIKDGKSDVFETGILSYEEQLAGVESLSKGLKQLTDVYSDVKDKGNFDWSSILNNADFKETFGGFTEEYDNFIKTISNSPNDINACQDAFNELATAYIYSKDELRNVTEETEDATVQMLRQMGVENADEVVTSALAKKKAQLAAEQEYLTHTSQEVSEATWQDINDLLEKGKVAGYTAKYLAQLAWQKIDFNNIHLKTNDEVESILNIAKAAGVGETYVNALRNALINLQNKANKSNNTIPISKRINDQKLKPTVYNETDPQDAVNDAIKDITDELAKIDMDDIYIPVDIGDKPNDSTSSDKNKETIETFDHIETKLESITKKTEKLAKAFEKTFTLKGTEKKFKEYLSQIDKEVEANNTAISTYQQKLDSIGLSADWIEKIKSGDYSIEDVTDETLKNQIKEYQKWYDKKVQCEENLTRLEEERLQAQATFADKITEYYDKEIKKIEKLISKRERLIKLKETFGGSASAKDIQYQIDKNTDMIDEYNEQNEELLKLRDQQEKGSDAWNTYNEQIKENKESIRDLTQEIAELAVEMANLPIEEYEKYIEKNQKKSDLYDAKKDNSTSTTERNKYIDKQIKLLDKNNKKAQETAEETAKNIDTEISDIKSAKSADKKGKSQVEKAKIDLLYDQIQKKYIKKKKQIPASILQELSEKGYSNLLKQCKQYNAAILANETAQETAKLSAEETEAQKRALQKQKFDNIQTKYERKQDDIDHKTSKVNSKMQLAQAKGYLDSAKWYDMLIGHEKEKQKSLKEERKKLVAQLENIKYGTDDWWDAQDAIQAVDEEIANSTVSMQELINTQRQVEFDNFDYKMGQISRLTEESNFLIDMMQNKEMTNDNGGLSDYGIASLGLHFQNLDTYAKQAEFYDAEIKRIQEMLKEEPYNTDLIAQLQEYQDAQRDALTATEQTKKSIVDLAKEGFQKLADSISKVADKYKEMLRSAKDANDYQNTITEKTEEADKLRKQIIAYSNMSGNEEIAAKLQQANKELKDIEKDIQETMYERYISDTENALDELLYELETYINELDFEQIFNNAMNTVNDNTGTISEILTKLAGKNGTSLSVDMSSVWKDGYTPEKGFKSVVDKIDELIKVANESASSADENKPVSSFGSDTKPGGTAPSIGNWGGATYHEYAKGSHGILRDQLGWTQENGGEIILRKSDGALLTPLGKGDKVFTNEMSENLWKLAQANPVRVNLPTMPKFDAVPLRNVGGGDTIIEIGDINMNGINDVETFGRQLREEICRNGKTTRCITEAVSAQQHNKGIGSALRYR